MMKMLLLDKRLQALPSFGILLAMARQTYGTTPWGAWFLEMLKAYDDSGRLSRGKTYANTGKVNSLVVNGQTAGAKVKGKPQSAQS